MARYLYIFTYQTPQQASVTADSPDESCEAVFIEAPSSEEALAWGRQISDRFLKRIFASSSVTAPARTILDWIELNPENEYPQEVLGRVKAVSIGEFPDL